MRKNGEICSGCGSFWLWRIAELWLFEGIARNTENGIQRMRCLEFRLGELRYSYSYLQGTA